MDYAALAKKFGGTPIATPIAGGSSVDYASMAAKFGGKATASPTPTTPVSDYANQSANPAVTDTNPTPGLWSKLWAGTPFQPISEGDVNKVNKDISTASISDLGTQINTTGKILANVFSDAPGLVAGIFSLINPLNYIVPLVTKGSLTDNPIGNMIKSVGKISTDTGNAIGTGIATGDWSQLTDNLKETEISAMNHPLSTLLMLDGGLKAISDVATGIYNDGLSSSMEKMSTDTVKKVKGYVNDITNARKNIATAFTSKSTINTNLMDIQKTLSDSVAAFKATQDLKGKLTSFTDKPKADVAGAQENVNINADQQAKINNDLGQAQENLDALNKQHTEQVNKMAADQQAEMKIKSGFNTPSDMSKTVSGFFKSAFDRASAVYDKNLGDAKIDVNGVIDSLNKYKDELFKGSKTKSADVAQNQIDQLKLRQIVGGGDITDTGKTDKFGNPVIDDSGIYKKLIDSGVNPKLYEKLTPDQLKQRYPALTSDYLKTAKNAIYKSIETGADESSLREYNQTVMPAFDSAFDSAVKDTYGEDTLAKIKQTDALWSDLRKNPLSSIENPTLNQIQTNWKSFIDSASKVEGGKELITKIQNSVGEQILNNSEIGGEYSASKIQTAIKKYSSILDDTTKNRLNQVATTINDKTAIENQQKQIEDLKIQQKAITTEGKVLNKALDKVESDASSIGVDSADVEKKIMSIDSIEKLNTFLKDTGKTIKEVTPVIIQALVEQADKEAGKGSGANYDLQVIDSFIKKMDALGGSSSDGQAVNDALLGGKDSAVAKAFNEMKDLNDKYQKLVKEGSKKMGTAGRIFKASFGAFLAVGGLGFGRFKGISDLRSAFAGPAEDIPGGRERIVPSEPSTKGAKIKKAATAGAVIKIGQQNNQNQ